MNNGVTNIVPNLQLQVWLTEKGRTDLLKGFDVDTEALNSMLEDGKRLHPGYDDHTRLAWAAYNLAAKNKISQKTAETIGESATRELTSFANTIEAQSKGFNALRSMLHEFLETQKGHFDSAASHFDQMQKTAEGNGRDAVAAIESSQRSIATEIESSRIESAKMMERQISASETGFVMLANGITGLTDSQNRLRAGMLTAIEDQKKAAAIVRRERETARARELKVDRWVSWSWRAAVVILLVFMATKARAAERFYYLPEPQTSQIDVITFRNAAGTSVKAFASPFTIKEGTGITFSVSGATLTVTASGAGSVPTSRTITTTSPLTGGGDLSANRTFALAGLSGLGTANQMLGMNNGATAYEYKTLIAGTNITITHSAGGITFDAGAGGSGITSLNGLIGSTQTFTDDTNVTVVSGGTAHVITWSGQLASDRGGTGNGFTKFSGPASTEKTFTLPNASTTVLTTNAAVTVPQGGTGLATLTNHALQVGAGTSTPTQLGLGTTTQVLHGAAAGDPTWSAVSLTADVTGLLPVANHALGIHRTLSAQFGDIDCLSAPASAGNCVQATGSAVNWLTNYVIPSSTITTNTVLRVTAVIEFTSSASPNFIISLKLGTVPIYTSPAIVPVSMTTKSYGLSWVIQGTAAPGASVSVQCGSTMGFWRLNDTQNTLAQPVAGIATNANITLQLAGLWSATTAGNTAYLKQLIVEQLN